MRNALWIAALSVTMVAGACSDSTPDVTEPQAKGVVLRVVLDGEVAADWSLTDLEDRVDFAERIIDGDKQTGPLLQDVLAASGISEWESAEVVGMGEGRVFEVGLNISSSEVDEGWILDVTKQGTLKLASAELPREQWVRDVGEINIP